MQTEEASNKILINRALDGWLNYSTLFSECQISIRDLLLQGYSYEEICVKFEEAIKTKIPLSIDA